MKFYTAKVPQNDDELIIQAMTPPTTAEMIKHKRESIARG